MTDTPELPDDVVAAIRANRKIEAIKRLREARGLGLKEAKHAVEAYARANPDAVASTPELKESGANPLVIIIILAVLGYIAYQFLA
jgi:ribosomal protein L7/L12